MGRYDTEAAANESVAQYEKEDAMYETAKLLVEFAMKAHMEQFNVSREIAGYPHAGRFTRAISAMRGSSIEVNT